MRSHEQIKAEIQEKFGFFPPFFSPALANPAVLENLWQQTLSSYVNNPLSSLFKEKLSAYLSRYCAVPYCMICHSCSLIPLEIKARDILQLLESPPPTESEIDKHIKMLAAQPDLLIDLPEAASPLEESLLYCAIYISVEKEQAEYYRMRLRGILGDVNYQHLVMFVAYVKTCHAWIEAHPEIPYEADKRVINYLAPLLQEEPALDDFFGNYVEQVKRERQSRAQRLAEKAERKRNEEKIRQSEERYRTLVEQAADGIFIVDAEGNYIDVNTSGCKMLGYSREQILSLSLSDVVSSEEISVVPQAIEKIKAGKSQVREWQMKRFDGTLLPVEVSTKILPDGRLQGIARDISDRKQAEKRFRFLTEAIPQQVWTSLPDGKLDYVNGRVLEYFGSSFSEIIGSGWQSMLHPDDLPACIVRWSYSLSTGELYEIEFRLFRKVDETYRWHLGRALPIMDEKGSIVSWFGTNTDIHDRKQAEFERDGFFTLSLDLLCIANLDGYFTHLNPAWETTLGYTIEELLAQPFLNFVHPEDTAATLAEIEKLASGVPTIYFENRYRCQDGSFKWLAWKAAPVVETGLLYCLARDITPNKLAQEELQRQNLRSQLFAEISLKIRQFLQIESIIQTSVTEVQRILQADRVLIYRIWPDGSGSAIAEAVLPGWASLLGQTFPSESIPEKHRQMYALGRIAAYEDFDNYKGASCLVKFFLSFNIKAKLVVPIIVGETLWGLIIAHHCAKTRKWSSFESELLQQLANQIGIALAGAQLLEQETRQRQELMRSNEELQQFAYIASHDLQEPLRKIQAFGDRLKTKYHDTLDEQGRDYLDRMQNAAQRMQVLINDLLALSRVTIKSQSLVPVNLAQVASEVVSDLEVLLQKTEGRVEIGELPTIYASPLQMRQLLQNLIGNALKFHREEEPPVVKIYSELLKTQEQQPTGISPVVDVYQIFVEDNGIGFEEKYLDRIFNIFQRLHSHSEYSGSGMGLAICRKIVEHHGGSITAQSTPGQGTTFIATLPIKPHKGENS